MAFITYNKLWEIEFDNIVSTKDKIQDINLNQLILSVHDTYKKDDNIITFYEHSNDEDVINKAYLDEKISK